MKSSIMRTLANTKNSFVTAVTSLVLMSYSGSLIPLAYATDMPTSPGSSTPFDFNCDQQCSDYSTSDGSGVAGLRSTPDLETTWSDTNDGPVCDELMGNDPIFHTPAPTPTSTSTSTSTPTATSTSTSTPAAEKPLAQVSYCEGLSIGPKTLAYLGSPLDEAKCKKAKKWKSRCAFRGSALESQCMAYLAITNKKDGAKEAQQILFNMDIAVVGTCGVACFLTIAGPWAAAPQYACSAAALIESITQLAKANGLNKDSGVMDFITQLGGAGGVGLALAQGGFATRTTGKIGSYTEAEQRSNEQSGRKMACATAVAFGAMAAARLISIGAMTASANKACQNIKNLVKGYSANPDPDNGGGSGINGNNILGFDYGNLTGLGGTTITSAQDRYEACVAKGGDDLKTECSRLYAEDVSQNSSALAGGLDGKAILSSGHLGTFLSKVPPSQELLDLGKSQGASAIFSQLFPASKFGDLADTFSKAAALAENDKAFAAAIGAPTGLEAKYNTGGASRAPNSVSEGTSPFSLGTLGTGSSGNGNPSGASALSFSTSGKTDIWHTGTTSNLFEIVSEKLVNASSRVELSR